MSSATVINVLLFLNIASKQTAVVGAVHQSTERDIPFGILRAIVTG
ncbi:MAG: hypothetical protein ABI286_06120 [Edaphobacter sp.]